MEKLEELLRACTDLLESGDTAGCSEGLVVCGSKEYAELQAAVQQFIGETVGEVITSEEEEEETT